MTISIKMARKNGKGIVAVKNGTHFGIAGYYSLMAAKNNLVGITITNGSPAVVPPGGLVPLLGTNVLSIAFPNVNSFPIVLDVALSSTSLGNLLIADENKEKVPSFWASTALQKQLNFEDELMINPSIIYNNRMITPMGAGDRKSEYKGFNLSLMVDLFLALVLGGDFSFLQKKGEASQLFLAYNPFLMNTEEMYAKKLEMLIKVYSGSSVLSGYEKLRLPGEKAFYLERKRLREGVPMNSLILQDLKSLLKGGSDAL